MRIGILAGMGASAGVRFYDMIVKECQKKGAKEDRDFPEIIIYNMASKGLDNTGVRNERVIKNDLLSAIELLNRCDIERIAVACNTVHIYLDLMQNRSKAHILNIPQIAMDSCKGKKFGVICSRTSERLGLYKQAQVHCLEYQQSRVDEIIGRVISGENNHKDKSYLLEIASSMRGQEADKIIVGCTELSIIGIEGADILDSGELAIKELLK